jgi:death-on-curing protein
LPNEPRWLPIEVVIQHNRLEVDASGENHFVRDHGLLESALARPRNAFAYGEEDIVTLAVLLIAGIARAHAFEQGNKRTAFEAMWHLLRINGYDLAIEDSESWAEPVTALIEHALSEEDFASALRPYVVPRDDDC